MIHLTKESNLFATGLSLKKIGEVLTKSTLEEEIQASLKEIDVKYLNRYLIFSEYKTLVNNELQKLPIIPIIVGIPGIGKTTIAKELSTALSIGIVIGGDTLRSSLRSIITKRENEIFHDSIYNTWKYFGDYSRENLILGYKSQAKIMNKVVERMIIDRGLRDGESMIVEYLHFLPTQFTTKFLKHVSIIPILLEISDETIYQERLEERSKYSHLRSSGDRLLKQMDKYLEIQDFILSECSKKDFEIVNMNNLSKGLDKILDYVLKRIDQLNKLKDTSIDIGEVG